MLFLRGVMKKFFLIFKVIFLLGSNYAFSEISDNGFPLSIASDLSNIRLSECNQVVSYIDVAENDPLYSFSVAVTTVSPLLYNTLKTSIIATASKESCDDYEIWLDMITKEMTGKYL